MMKKKLQRFLAFSLVMIMTLPFIACGKDTNTNLDGKQPESSKQSESSKKPESSKQTESSKNTEAAGETYSIYDTEKKLVKLTMGNLTAITTQPNGDDVYDNLFKDFMKDAYNIEYEFEIEGVDRTEYLPNLSLAITGGDLPDVFQVRELSMLNELVEEGLVLDITELYAKYETDYIREMYASVEYDHFAVVRYDDAIYAVPRANSSSASVVWIRQDWMDKLGIKVDEDGNGLVTLDEIKMLASEFVTKDPGNSGNPVGIAAIDGGDSNYNYKSNLVNSAFGAHVGYWYQAEDGSFVSGATVPGMKDALAWWRDMYSEGLLDPQYGITKVEDVKTMLSNGQSGITFGDHNAPTWVWNDGYVLDKTANWVAYGLDNGTGMQGNAQANEQGRYMCISSECENPDAAMKLILWDMTLQVATAYAGGVKEAIPADVLEWIQKDYTEFYEQYLVDAAPCTFKRVNPMQFSTYNQKKNQLYYYNILDYEAGKIAKDALTDVELVYVEGMEHIKDGTATEKERMKVDELDGARAKNHMMDNGLVLWTAVPVQLATDVTAIYEGELTTMVAEMMLKIITGEEPLDYFDTFVEKYYKSGGAEIVKEYEEFYN